MKGIFNADRRVILMALSARKEPVYEGTVNPDEVKKRRAKNKRARQSRRQNRGGD